MKARVFLCLVCINTGCYCTSKHHKPYFYKADLINTINFAKEGTLPNSIQTFLLTIYQMQRISALFNKTPRDCKQKDSVDVGDDSSYSSRSFGTTPRLVRSPVIRGLRHPDDADLSGIFLNGADNSSESTASGVRSASNLQPTNFKMGSPLPSPPRSPVQMAIQASSLWPLPSPRQPPKKTEDSDKNLNGLESGHGLPSHQLEGQMPRPLQSTIPTENHQRFSSPSGISGSPRVGGTGPASHTGGLPSRLVKSGGGDVHTHVHTKQVEPSIPNGHFSSALRSPHESGNPRLWKHEQGFHGDRPAADEFSSADYSPMVKYSYQNGTSSRDVGHSRHHSKTVGTPTSSPPLSPSAVRTLSPGGWQKGHLLGSGAFGKVYKGIHSETGEFCAIKEVEFVKNDHRSKESAKQLEKEIASLSTLQHPNIVQYKGSEMVGDNLYIYLELISGGSLHKLYQEFKKLEEPVIRRYTRQILLGLQYLHSRKFVHRDIKCANILVDQDGTIKLADFGVAKYIKEQGVPFSLKGSPHWMAPEVIMSSNTGYEYAVDIWSLGCTVIEMVTGKPPWCDLEAAAAMFKVTKVGAPPIPKSLSPDGQNFLRLCLQRNPADRPTAAALLEHPFVQIYNDAYYTTVHAFDALNALDLGETRMPSPASSMHPSLSAPSSPGSSHRPIHGFNFSQPDLVSFSRDPARGLPSAKLEQNRAFRNSSISPHEGRGKPKNKLPSSDIRRTHEFSQTQDRPSLSAPVSPKSAHRNLYPTRSADILPGYPTPFSESRGNPRHSSELGKGFAAFGHTG